MIFSENRLPLFGIMLSRLHITAAAPPNGRSRLNSRSADKRVAAI